MNSLRLNAYVLLADPAFIEESVRSYYPLVDRIVASYDQSCLSWSGHSVRTDECIERLKRVDTQNKVEFVAGHFSAPQLPTEECETAQRNAALQVAGAGADWVVQLDADEVLPDSACFAAAIANADRRGCSALDFPARWFFAEPRPGLFVERATRFLRTATGFPGSAAVRVGQSLAFCRQIADPPARPLPQIYRVDIRRRSADPARKSGWPVHAVVGRHQATLHFSWVRPSDEVSDRLSFHGHAKGIPTSFLSDWRSANDTPWRFVAAKAAKARGERYRLCHLPISQMTVPRFKGSS